MWTQADQTQAMSEGWLLSERDDGFLAIETYDDDPRHRFEGDNLAEDWVKAQAAQGSALHQKAVDFNWTPYK